ncbi:MAG: RagB/SusD family nutrient uptake outer membrane protein [Puia sp.]
MKKANFKIFLPLGVTVVALVFSCSKSFLTKPPIGSYTPDVVATKAGVDGLLIGAYSMLDGFGGAGSAVPGGGAWVAAGDNWVYGSVCADDSHKGSDPGDQPDIVSLMTWSEGSTNNYLEGKWEAMYDAVQRANEVLREMRLAKDITDTVQLVAESRFLRAWYHMELKKMYGNIPYVDESVTYIAGNWRVPNSADVATNNADVWPKIEADLNYAASNLPEKQTDIGRANKWAAECLLAKAYMFQQKYSDALPLLTTILASGTNSAGKKYALTANFYDNFNAETKNSTESVFAAQNSVNDGSTAANANQGDVLNYDYQGPIGCCGFNQPSYSLVNAFKTDPVTGYAMPDTYNSSNLKNDQGVKSTDPYTPDTTTPVDPRLDWTVGRRGIPYLDWGLNPGFVWVRNQSSAGPYLPLKNVPRKSQVGILTDKSSWTPGYSAININLIRFSDVILWAAECEVEVGSLDNAQADVNLVRARAANPAGFVPGSVANYKVSPYATGFFTGLGQAGARKYVQFERRLELAMEGQRFFDLVRWGTAATELNAYVAHEVSSGYLLIQGATFKPTAIYFAIPQQEIDASTIAGKATLTQNPGY